jgi:hypothetical protein
VTNRPHPLALKKCQSLIIAFHNHYLTVSREEIKKVRKKTTLIGGFFTKHTKEVKNMRKSIYIFTQYYYNIILTFFQC